MAELHSWHPIDENSDDKEVIITVDFTVTGRPVAGFTELAKHLETPYGIWESLPPAVGDETGMTGDDYLDRWTGELRASGAEVKAVFGYCASSVFALAIAERIATWQAKPRVVLFDPTAATGFTVLYYGFFRVVDALAAVLTEDEVRDAHAAGEAAQRTHDDLETLTKEFVRLYRDVGTTAFERVELDGLVASIRIGDPREPDVIIDRVEVDYALGAPWSKSGRACRAATSLPWRRRRASAARDRNDKADRRPKPLFGGWRDRCPTC